MRIFRILLRNIRIAILLYNIRHMARSVKAPGLLKTGLFSACFQPLKCYDADEMDWDL
jgi:hypothetical protein